MRLYFVKKELHIECERRGEEKVAHRLGLFHLLPSGCASKIEMENPQRFHVIIGRIKGAQTEVGYACFFVAKHDM